MGAAVGTTYGPSEVVHITDVPAPEMGPGDVRVRVHATTVNRAADHQPPHLKGHHMNDSEPSGAQKLFGDFAPALVDLTDDVLFGQVWTRTELSPKERSLITVASLTATGNTDQLVYHLDLAKQNGASETELIEAITHLAFYAGWPKAMAAMAVAKKVFRDE
jgi:4-carboxymuconolactone decarboxylase